MNGHTAHFSLFAYACLGGERERGAKGGGGGGVGDTVPYSPAVKLPLFVFITELLHAIQVEG